jgi:hypothetical protein
MSVDLSIGGEQFRIAGPPDVLKAVRERFGSFETSTTTCPAGRAPIRIEVSRHPNGFAPAYERPVHVAVRLSAPDVFTFDGGIRGRYSIAERAGWVEAVGLGGVDLLIRTALSVSLPSLGAVLVHGAALENGTGGAIAVCGASGSGKSTAAAALSGVCDELVVLRPDTSGLEITSTPYWRGRPVRERCTAVICLERGGTPGFARLRGASIARTLLRHVVRGAPFERVDRGILQVIGGVAASGTIFLASCPEAEAFLPFLEEHIASFRRAA